MPARFRIPRILKWTGTATCALIASPFLITLWMVRRFCTLRILKWAGTSGCLLVASLFIVSGWCTVFGVLSAEEGQTLAGTFFGAFGIRQSRLGLCFPDANFCVAELHGLDLSMSGLPHFDRDGWGYSYVIPLWLPFIAMLAPTLLLWFLDRRRRTDPGHCPRCNYNLNGLTSPRCPECGASLASTSTGSVSATGRRRPSPLRPTYR